MPSFPESDEEDPSDPSDLSDESDSDEHSEGEMDRCQVCEMWWSLLFADMYLLKPNSDTFPNVCSVFTAICWNRTVHLSSDG